MKNKITFYILILLLMVCNSVFAEVRRARFNSGNQYLVVETLDDDLIHFELLATSNNPGIDKPIYTSPMIDKKDYTGPTSYSQNGSVIETGEIKATVDTNSLCISLFDKNRNATLVNVCPLYLDQPWKVLTLSKEKMKNVYGLGQKFKGNPDDNWKMNSADGDWIRHKERNGGNYGNSFEGVAPAGMVGNVQFPVMYALGSGHHNYALFLDNVYKQDWDFQNDPWSVRMFGDQIRFYLMTGENLPDLRRDYLELVGRPPVPPKKAFGLWVSEFGYKDWHQIEDLRIKLRNDNFPADGFVLDLLWFGKFVQYDPKGNMGRLDWDLTNFPDPDQNIAFFANDNLGLITIEESYINSATDTFSQMKTDGDFLAYTKNNNQCDPTQQSNPIILYDWFGKAGMVDWSDPQAGKWIHDNKRFPNLVKKGIVGHWTDLGEPEKYDENACYEGVEKTTTGMKNQHADIHNLYCFLWNKSIYEGYVRKNNEINRRPFIVSRSGTSGSQRYGVAMWSGDIGSDLGLLATHLNAQMHMSFSGIDYYGADIGGFRREGMPCNAGHSGKLQYQDELYTQWLANGAWFDVPVRPHTDNYFQSGGHYDTAPNLVGKKEMNLANLRQRYELIPYYYSLAYRAYLYGEPVIAPLVFYYQDDVNVRQIGYEKLIGKDILVGIVANYGEYQRNVYLPQGKWVNYHTNDWFASSGNEIRNFPTYIKGVFRLPTFIKTGAIIPIMFVDDQTKDAFGHRKDNSNHDELIVKVYADATATQFTLYEDDGKTISYDSKEKPVYQTRTTVISQHGTTDMVTVNIKKADGNYNGSVDRRNNVVQLVAENLQATEVTVNGTKLAKFTSELEFNSVSSGWYNAGRNLIIAKSGVKNVNADKSFKFALESIPAAISVNFVCDNCWTNLGEDVYVAGSVSQLGNWDVNKAVKLNPNVYYEYIYNRPQNCETPGPINPKWTRLVRDLPSNTTIEWKLIKKLNTGQWQWETGDNHKLTTPDSGFSGTYTGSF